MGEEDARGSPTLRDLFDAHAGYVWSSLRRLGVPVADAEDVLHDVYLQVGRHLDDYDRSRPVRPWLFGFAFRLASQHRRRAHVRREELGAGEMDLPDEGPDALELVTRGETRALLLEALEEVDLDRRAVLVLYEIDEVPMKEIAQALDVPLNTAYSRLRLAREQLAAAVKRLEARRGGR